MSNANLKAGLATATVMTGAWLIQMNQTPQRLWGQQPQPVHLQVMPYHTQLLLILLNFLNTKFLLCQSQLAKLCNMQSVWCHPYSRNTSLWSSSLGTHTTRAGAGATSFMAITKTRCTSGQTCWSYLNAKKLLERQWWKLFWLNYLEALGVNYL